MNDQPIEGAIRPGPAPANATRPEVVIRLEDGAVTQAVVRLDDDTLIEISAPVDIDPDAFKFDEPRGPWDDVQFGIAYRACMAARLQVTDPRSLIRFTGT